MNRRRRLRCSRVANASVARKQQRTRKFRVVCVSRFPRWSGVSDKIVGYWRVVGTVFDRHRVMLDLVKRIYLALTNRSRDLSG